MAGRFPLRIPAPSGALRPQAPRTRAWAPDGPLHLGQILGCLRRGPGDPAFRVDASGAFWRVSRTPEGPATLRVTALGGTVRGDAWGPGAEWFLDRLPVLLGGEDRPGGFAPRHRLVAEGHRRAPGLRLARTGLVLESLIPSVLEQKVTADEAYRAWRRLLSRFGEPAPGPAPEGMAVPLAARDWALLPSWEWHRAGVDNKRSSTILRAVRVAARMEEAAGMTPAEARARLEKIPGIGPWTSAEVVQRTHGAPDEVTTGDLHLPRIVGWSLAGERDADDARMLELLAPYEGHRHRAVRYLLTVGSIPPRRAPKMRKTDIARW
ncbi:DNA-3-methyladenine glycosylase family protein [Streptomyces sp. NRRL F-5630]|uniref:DNA-3-methyladenine glycosylase family protein n=1 Tax=Streptomyces sp. NRRL F-5630 TaxID=1463864 RepID=UPI003D71BEF2